jgi:energy-coupling factor transporter ATP-binding protein EcfA2
VNNQADTLLRLRDWTLVRETPAGPVTLLRDVDLTIDRGEWVGVLGPNGSGKTSLLRFLASEESPLTEPVGLVFQDPEEQIVAATVAEELSLGRPGLPLADWLAAYGLLEVADRDPRLLSAGQKQRLAVAVAEAGAPGVMLCDEPTTLQDAEQADWLLRRIRSWRSACRGTVLWATQNPAEAARCDRLLIFNGGRLAADTTPAELWLRPAWLRLLAWPFQEAPAGGAAGRPSVSRPTRPCPPSMRGIDGAVAVWQGVGQRFGRRDWLFRGVDLVIEAGRRVGLTGRNGSGKSTLLALAAGLKAPAEGRCLLRDRLLYRRRETDLDHGLALLAPQFPEYLFTRATVAAEIALDPVLARQGVGFVLEAAGLPVAFAQRNPHELSSGEKRRLALAMVVLSPRPLLLLDEPVAGLDREGRGRITELLGRLPAETAVVIASHDRSFLSDCGCDLYELTATGLTLMLQE